MKSLPLSCAVRTPGHGRRTIAFALPHKKREPTPGRRSLSVFDRNLAEAKGAWKR